jgi:hypothetical protein
MWTDEQLKKKLADSVAAIQAVVARINTYSTEINKLNLKKEEEMQEALRLDGEVRILKLQIEGDKNATGAKNENKV